MPVAAQGQGKRKKVKVLTAEIYTLKTGRHTSDPDQKTAHGQRRVGKVTQSFGNQHTLPFLTQVLIPEKQDIHALPGPGEDVRRLPTAANLAPTRCESVRAGGTSSSHSEQSNREVCRFGLGLEFKF